MASLEFSYNAITGRLTFDMGIVPHWNGIRLSKFEMKFVSFDNPFSNPCQLWVQDEDGRSTRVDATLMWDKAGKMRWK